MLAFVTLRRSGSGSRMSNFSALSCTIERLASLCLGMSGVLCVFGGRVGMSSMISCNKSCFSFIITPLGVLSMVLRGIS